MKFRFISAVNICICFQTTLFIVLTMFHSVLTAQDKTEEARTILNATDSIKPLIPISSKDRGNGYDIFSSFYVLPTDSLVNRMLSVDKNEPAMQSDKEEKFTPYTIKARAGQYHYETTFLVHSILITTEYNKQAKPQKRDLIKGKRQTNSVHPLEREFGVTQMTKVQKSKLNKLSKAKKKAKNPSHIDKGMTEFSSPKLLAKESVHLREGRRGVLYLNYDNYAKKNSRKIIREGKKGKRKDYTKKKYQRMQARILKVGRSGKRSSFGKEAKLTKRRIRKEGRRGVFRNPFARVHKVAPTNYSKKQIAIPYIFIDSIRNNPIGPGYVVYYKNLQLKNAKTVFKVAPSSLDKVKSIIMEREKAFNRKVDSNIVMIDKYTWKQRKRVAKTNLKKKLKAAKKQEHVKSKSRKRLRRDKTKLDTQLGKKKTLGRGKEGAKTRRSRKRRDKRLPLSIEERRQRFLERREKRENKKTDRLTSDDSKEGVGQRSVRSTSPKRAKGKEKVNVPSSGRRRKRSDRITSDDSKRGGRQRSVRSTSPKRVKSRGKVNVPSSGRRRKRGDRITSDDSKEGVGQRSVRSASPKRTKSVRKSASTKGEQTTKRKKKDQQE